MVMVLCILQFGAFPVFVVDGTPSPLKSKTRIARFFRLSGIDTSDLQKVEDRISVDRNRKFAKCVKECVVGCFTCFDYFHQKYVHQFILHLI